MTTNRFLAYASATAIATIHELTVTLVLLQRRQLANPANHLFSQLFFFLKAGMPNIQVNISKPMQCRLIVPII